MQINSSYQLPLVNSQVQPSELSPQTELLKKSQAVASAKTPRPTSESFIEAEYVDLHQPVARPFPLQPTHNSFILEQSPANSFGQAWSNAQSAPPYSLLQGIEGYRKGTQDNIPSGLYLDFFA